MVSPGPKAIATTRPSTLALKSSLILNRIVGDDMFPDSLRLLGDLIDHLVDDLHLLGSMIIEDLVQLIAVERVLAAGTSWDHILHLIGFSLSNAMPCPTSHLTHSGSGSSLSSVKCARNAS